MNESLRDSIVIVGDHPLGHNDFMPMCLIEDIGLT